MICAVCRKNIGEKLACPYCWERRGLRAMIDQQRIFAAVIASGKAELPVTTAEGEAHIALLGFRHQAYCGKPISRTTRRYVAYEDLSSVPSLCRFCKNALAQLIAAQEAPV